MKITDVQLAREFKAGLSFIGLGRKYGMTSLEVQAAVRHVMLRRRRSAKATVRLDGGRLYDGPTAEAMRNATIKAWARPGGRSYLNPRSVVKITGAELETLVRQWERGLRHRTPSQEDYANLASRITYIITSSIHTTRA